ncbi:MAG: hypothetical protein ACK4K0_10570 [Flavobacteriales bacterium]
MNSNKVELNGFRFKYPTLKEFLAAKNIEKKDISDVLSYLELLNLDNDLADEDTLIKHKGGSKKMGAPSDTSKIKIDNVFKKLEFGTNSPEILYPFFEKLQKLSSSKGKMRIFHYGDSQIEGDRITSYFRQKLQPKFGGVGPGLVPAMNVYNTVSFNQTLSENFKRYTVFWLPDKNLPHKMFGVMGSFARFTPVLPDSLIATQSETSGWIDISPSNRASGNARKYNRVRMYYGNCIAPVLLNVYQGGEIIHQEKLVMDGGYHNVNLTFDETPENLKYEFKGAYSPDIYFFALDGNYGLSVDNIAMRGSSGTFLNGCDLKQMSSMYNELGVELFIMQYGGNALPHLKDSVATVRYANWFGSQLKTLKRLKPGAAVIVIGPSDMSVKDGEDFITYPLLPYLITQMKKATFDAGAAYWDIYAAMGGENSMPAWVEKGLAGADYIHFSSSGARYIAELFSEAFLYEYKCYENAKANQKETVETN